uniref:Uncharacterized protein TCIL3000_9_2180 n=1 Tax=Trypanosoma congolense (strain IL3000) TaxID=1068625 RepID=G0UTV7_TRYCI|nr:unnamed protein product [Trypanosoma congolense IL3000]
MKLHTPDSHDKIAWRRRYFFVAPPSHNVINRCKPTEVPHNLSVIVATNLSAVQAASFLRPIASLEKRSDNVGKSRSTFPLGSMKSTLDTAPIPPLFKVEVYVWNDTTLREILEEVLCSSPAAARVLLPPDASAADAVSSAASPDARGAVVDDKQSISEDSVMDGSKSSPDRMSGGEAPAKRSRLETKSESDSGELHGKDLSQSGSHRREGELRSPHDKPAKVYAFRVFIENEKPKIENIALLNTTRPIFHSGDYMTMKELRGTVRSPCKWKLGDLLVFTPTVQYYRPA